MKLPPAPIRFLLLVVGGWAALRLVMLAPAWVTEPSLASPFPARSVAQARPSAPATPPLAQNFRPSTKPTATPPFGQALPFRPWPAAPSFERSPFFRTSAPPPARPPRTFAALGRPSLVAALPPSAPAFAPQLHGSPPRQLAPAPPFGLSPTPNLAGPRSATSSRWSGSAWVFLRNGAADPGLAAGGTLGGSQAGARLAYRLNRDPARPLALSARLYAPLDRPQGAEAALGLDWRPLAGVPVHILAERRQRLGREGRSDFSLTVYGGGEQRLLRGRLRVEAYAQAGIVGIEERDLFADAAVRAGVPVGPVEVGGGAWAGAQPGAARVDIGPQASARLPVGRATVRASAEWRFRIAGDAAPGSGPTLTLSTDF